MLVHLEKPAPRFCRKFARTAPLPERYGIRAPQAAEKMPCGLSLLPSHASLALCDLKNNIIRCFLMGKM